MKVYFFFVDPRNAHKPESYILRTKIIVYY